VTLTHWLYWLAAFLIVLAILAIAACLQEWMLWRKEERK
jgi:hypothetical protein